MLGWEMVLWTAVLFAAWNLVTFLLMLADKRKAKAGKWRIRERTLLWCAFFFGGAGVFIGMYALRHKVQNRKFAILVPIAMLCSAMLLRAVIDLILWKL